MINEIIIAVAILVGLGLFFAIVLAIAHNKLKVEEDPRIDQIEEMLPSANCGACGEPGCRAFAERLVNQERSPAHCTVCTNTEIDKIASFLGVEAGSQEKRVARLLCAGGKNEAHNLADYRGTMTSCRAEAVVAGGIKACTWGCLGLGDCVEVCDFEAIYLNADGLPVVLPDLCTACNDCVEICPKGLFELMPVNNHLIVQCKSLLEGDLAEEKCSVACTACARCVADAAPGLIEINSNLAVINYNLNQLASPYATRRCPTNAIVWVDWQQFSRKEKSFLPLGRVEKYEEDQDYSYH